MKLQSTITSVIDIEAAKWLKRKTDDSKISVSKYINNLINEEIKREKSKDIEIPTDKILSNNTAKEPENSESKLF